MKLIRDKYIDTIEINKLDLTEKDDTQKLHLLLDKIQEEAVEFLESKQKDPEELADLMEVIVAWGQLNGISFDTINHLRKKKHKELGGFEKFIVLKDGE